MAFTLKGGEDMYFGHLFVKCFGCGALAVKSQVTRGSMEQTEWSTLRTRVPDNCGDWQ